jgi:hypothetical protein
MESKLILFTKSDLKDIINECLQNIREGPKIVSESDVLKLEEAAKLISISPHTLRKHTKRGLLKRHLPEIRGYRYLRSELLRYSDFYRKNN